MPLAKRPAAILADGIGRTAAADERVLLELTGAARDLRAPLDGVHGSVQQAGRPAACAVPAPRRLCGFESECCREDLRLYHCGGVLRAGVLLEVPVADPADRRLIRHRHRTDGNTTVACMENGRRPG